MYKYTLMLMFIGYRTATYMFYYATILIEYLFQQALWQKKLFQSLYKNIIAFALFVALCLCYICLKNNV